MGGDSDRGGRYSIRQALNDEEDALAFVCLKTGDSGDDGTHLFTDDPGCLARIYTTPYLRQNPECAFVLCDAELEAEGLEGYPWSLAHPERGVVGYCLATVDSTEFYHRYVTEALPPLRAAFPKPTGPIEEWTNAQHVHNEYHNDICFPEALGGTANAPYVPSWVIECFPAHLHIDILAHVHRGGWGTKLTLAQLQRLTELGAVGVHLIMSPVNYRAFKFYKALGFVEVARADGDLILGRALAPAHPLYPSPTLQASRRCFGVVVRPLATNLSIECIGGYTITWQRLSMGTQ
jgi:ribosomal protein S18 acetylase RimI-like enzyme